MRSIIIVLLLFIIVGTAHAQTTVTCTGEVPGTLTCIGPTGSTSITIPVVSVSCTTPTPTPSAVITPTPIVTPTPSPSPTIQPTVKPTPTPSSGSPTPSPSPTPVLTPTPTPTPVPDALPTFIGRSQNSMGTASVSLSLTVPSTTLSGDFIGAWVTSYAHAITCPSGLNTQYSSSCGNSGSFYLALCWKIASSTDAGNTYTWQTLGYPKGIIRVYRNVSQTTPIDQGSPLCGTSTSANSGTLPALKATSNPNELYEGTWFNSLYAITGPTDLLNTTADSSQWFSFEGDKIISIAGTIPNAEKATATSGIWQGYAVTLNPN